MNLVHNALVELPPLGPSHCPLWYLWPLDTIKSPKSEWGGEQKKTLMWCWIFHLLHQRNSEKYSNSVVLQNGTWWMPSPLQLEVHSWIFQTMFLHTFFHLSFWASSMIPLLPWGHSSSFVYDSTSSASSMIPLLQLLPWSHFFSFIYNPIFSASFHDSLLQLLPWYPCLRFFHDPISSASSMIPFLHLLAYQFVNCVRFSKASFASEI